MWSPVALFIMGGRLEIIGKEKIVEDKPCVVMSNHCSYLDIPALFIAMPFKLYFIAKKELKRMPFLGWFIALSGAIFIDRKNTAKAKESLAEAAKLIANGKNIVVFPEGTASKNGVIAEFKKGGFHLANDAGVNILPVKIEGTYHVWPSGNKLNVRRGIITVIIGDPILPEKFEKSQLDSKIDFVRNTILNLKK
ncbi:MAG: 1-acyl-sn-glycerol-3-phosphate acyltransferase [Crocinitomicaceae bacterium]|nr:1-acyl-sn-glycerol-3-phosphate acyltransferase [Crocinitomicaceae bacterium]